MASKIRIATFNLENLDDKPGEQPDLQTRLKFLQPQLTRINADILCLQEINGQETPGLPRDLLALKNLLKGSQYENYKLVSTKLVDGSQVYDERNLVILSRFDILEARQYKHTHVQAPAYRKVTADPAETQADEVTWERPILHARIKLAEGMILEVLNLHLKSRRPSDIPGQKSGFAWKSISGWAEGFFLSSMKRVGQALETRMLIDKLFEANQDAMIVAAGDFNADLNDVAMEAIRGDVENTENSKLALFNMIPCERTIPEPARFSLYHRGKGSMLDHLLISRALLPFYRHTEIHNEVLHDESAAFADDKKYPESDHAPVVAEFELPV